MLPAGAVSGDDDTPMQPWPAPHSSLAPPAAAAMQSHTDDSEDEEEDEEEEDEEEEDEDEVPDSDDAEQSSEADSPKAGVRTYRRFSPLELALLDDAVLLGVPASHFDGAIAHKSIAACFSRLERPRGPAICCTADGIASKLLDMQSKRRKWDTSEHHPRRQLQRAPWIAVPRWCRPPLRA